MKRTLLFCLVIVIIGCKKDPMVSFSTDGSAYYLAQNISFTNSSKNAKDFMWDFGDGASSNQTSPTHTYEKAGVYNVRLTANNGIEFSRKIKIHPGTASYTVLNNLEVTISNLVSFYQYEGNLYDFTSHEEGNFNNGRRTDTVFTNRNEINCGFFYGPYAYITDRTVINKSMNTNIVLSPSTRVVKIPRTSNSLRSNMAKTADALYSDVLVK